MFVKLTSQKRVEVEGEQRPIDRDREQIAALMLDAYRGTIDDEGESIVEARAEIDKTIHGEYGKFLPDYSRVVVRDNRIISAILVTEWQGNPFLVFAMTAKAWQRKGLSKSCMINVMQDLYESQYSILRLSVTTKNLPAVNLYVSLGFVSQQTELTSAVGVNSAYPIGRVPD